MTPGKKGTGAKLSSRPPIFPTAQTKEKGCCCKIVLRGRHLFEKRLSSPPPIFQKLSAELLFPATGKAIPTFLNFRYPSFLKQNAEQRNKEL